MKPQILVIVGPTGVGKTKISINLASKLQGEIISADSMQIYKKLDIGTAKISPLETNGIPHYMIDIVDPDQSFSVADFQAMAKSYIYQIYAKEKLPLVVGGTGLYIQSLIDVYQFQEQPVDLEKRNELLALANKKGNQYVHNMLEKIDPALANKLHPNDLRRVIRGIEYFEITGARISEISLNKSNENPEFNPIIIGLTMDRELLYRRIDERVDNMIANGLVEEVKSLVDAGYSPNLVSLQGLGYKEIIGYLQGDYQLAEGIRILKRNTRHFAKRQITWFKRDSRIKWFNLNQDNQLNNLSHEIYCHIAGLLKQ